MARKFGVEKGIEHRRRHLHAGPALARIAERQRKPFAPHRRLPARPRRVRRDEGGVGQQALPGAADIDQVVAVGAVAVQEDDELLRFARARRQARAVEFSHFWISFSSLSCRADFFAAPPG